MAGSQIFKAKDAPYYIPGVIGCAICFGLEFAVLVCWRIVLVLRNRRLDKAIANDGLTEEERTLRAKKMGEEDKTDFENPYFRYTL